MYVDSNVFIYAALDTSEIGDNAREFLGRIQKGEVRAVISPLVFDEVLWVIQRNADRDAAYEIGESMLSLPLSWVDVSYHTVQHAMVYYKEGLDPRDAIHVGIMKDYNINVIITEDRDFDKIEGIQRKEISEVSGDQDGDG